MKLSTFRFVFLCFVFCVVNVIMLNAQSAEFYRNAAENGHSFAQNNLGNCYKTGNGVEQDYQKAVYWYRKAAEKGLSEAQFNLAVCYADGMGVEQDINQAILWCSKAADKFYLSAYYNLGAYYEKIGEYIYAAYWYRKAVDAKQPMAQYNLAVYLDKGIYVKKDEVEAFLLFRKAARADIVEAQYNVGLCYYYRKGVQQRYKRAFQWFSKAAEKGHKESRYYLGLCYLTGKGVRKNPESAFSWFLKAAEQGDVKAQLQSGLCYQEGIGTNKDFEKAFNYFKTAAQENNSEALNQLGYCYANGIGTFRDINQALNCWNKVALDTTAKSETTGYAKKMIISVRNESDTELNNSFLKVEKSELNSLSNSIGTYPDKEKYGIHFGFQNKQWICKNAGSSKKYGFWTDSEILNGGRIGLSYQPQFGKGLGISTGLFYEYFYSKSSDYYYSSMRNDFYKEHTISIPAHVQFRLHLKPRLSCFVYTGLSLDYGLSASVKAIEKGSNIIKSYYPNIYNIDEWGNEKRFNTSVDLGGGIRIGFVQFDAGLSRGLINQSSVSGLKIKQNKNLILSMSFWF